METKKQRNIVIGLVILAVIVALISFQNLPLAVSSSDKIVWQPNWGTMYCRPSGSYEAQISNNIDEQTIFKCDAYTDECRLNIECNKNDIYDFRGCIGRYTSCDVNGANCDGAWGGLLSGWIEYRMSLETEKVGENVIDRGASVKFDTGWIDTINEDGTNVILQWKPWRLWREEFGQNYISNSNGCSVSSTWTDNVVNDNEYTDCIQNGQLTFSDSCNVINYMTHYSQAEGNVYNWNGNEYVCQARTLYYIDEEEFVDGETRYIMGDTYKIAKEGSDFECCEYEPNCENFQIVQITDPTCPNGYDYECPNGGKPIRISTSKYSIWTCGSDYKCIQNLYDSECATDNDCLQKYGTDKGVCDLTPGNYGKCIKSQTPPYCGDGICDQLEGETATTCPEDCGNLGECKDCFAWFTSKFKPADEVCVAKTYFQREWYNPMTWVLPEGGITQAMVCPLFLGFIVIVGAIVIFIVVLIFRVISKGKKGGKRK